MEEELETIIKIQAEIINELYIKLAEYEVINKPLTCKIENVARQIYERGIEL